MDKAQEPGKFLGPLIMLGIIIELGYKNGVDPFQTAAGIMLAVGVSINTIKLVSNPIMVAMAIMKPHLFLFMATIMMIDHITGGKHGKWATQYTEHGASGSIASAIGNLVGSNYKIFRVGAIDFNSEIFDEYAAMQNADDARKWIRNSNLVYISVWYLAAIFGAYYIMGPMGMVYSTFLVLLYLLRPDSGNGVSSKEYAVSKPLLRQEGVYKIYQTVWGSERHRGIGYLKDGTFYTRMHVTSGYPIELEDGTMCPPSYKNTVTDNVAYGAPPRFAKIVDGDEVVVALTGPISNAIVLYRTHVSLSDDGQILMRGNRSIPGASGSPVFKYHEAEVTDDTGNTVTHKEYRFVGSLGWFAPCDVEEDTLNGKSCTEVMAEEKQAVDHDVPIINGHTTQVFQWPGSGKTWNLMPDLVAKGIMTYGRVYVTGPTKVVCEEITEALSKQFPGKVADFTSKATSLTRGTSMRPVIVAAHATMLSMLVKGNSTTRPAGLWIMDESHFANSRSLMLKDYLRAWVKKKKGSLVEMTATGYDFRSNRYITKDGSNYQIDDVTMNPNDMPMAAIESAKTKKVVFFVTKLEGRGNDTASGMARRAVQAGVNHVTLSRATFNQNYKMAANMEIGIILTTDISECGANFRADEVYDMQKTTKPVCFGAGVFLEPRLIDKGQRVQRRGRIGRHKVGTYYSPNYELRDCDTDRAEYYDRVVFANSLGIDILDPVPTTEPDFTLTDGQIRIWIDPSENSIESYRMVDMLFEPGGRPRTEADLKIQLAEWRKGNVTVPIGPQQDIEVTFWDDRDKKKLLVMARRAGCLNLTEENQESSLLKSFIDRMAMHVPRFGGGPIPIKRTQEEAPETILEADEERKEGEPPDIMSGGEPVRLL